MLEMLGAAARACVLCPKTDRRDENGHVADNRHARLISLDYSPVSRSYPHSNPQPGSGWRAERAMASGFLA